MKMPFYSGKLIKNQYLVNEYYPPWKDALEYATKNAEEAIKKEKKMNIIEAWRKANVGQEIKSNWAEENNCEKICPSQTRKIKDAGYDLYKAMGSLPAGCLLADDWKVVQIPRKEVYTMRDFRDKVANVFGDCLAIIPDNAIVTIEWTM
jgi:hypothetical protein